MSVRNQRTLPGQNPFADWDISQRYADGSDFNQEFVDPHRQATQHLFTLLQQATT